MVPPNLRWGDGPCIRPPNILRSSVVGCARKYEQSKKRCFSCEGDIRHLAFNIVNILKIWKNKGEIQKTWSMTKKRSSEIFAVKMEIFPPKTSSWSANIFFVAPKLSARSPPLDRDRKS